MATLLFLSQSITAHAASQLSLPADFLFHLNVPGAQEQFRRPGKVFFDPTAGELYAVDHGHNRILIFDEAGTYKFEFSTAGYCGSIVDFAVATDGTVVALGTTRGGMRILRFDFDGTFIDSFAPPSAGRISSLALSGRDELYLLDEANGRVIAVAADGQARFTIPLSADIPAEQEQERSLGTLTIAGGILYVPASSEGQVLRFTLDGQPLRSLGFAGSRPGEFGFPTAVAIAPNGMVLVLDKQRFNVLCFAPDDTFMGEFGGKGSSDGWFYYPSWIAVDSRGQVYVSQIFQNRAQAVAVPEPIRKAFLQHGSEKDVDPTLQSHAPDRHPRTTAAQDRKTNAVLTNHNVTKTPTQLWEV